MDMNQYTLEHIVRERVAEMQAEAEELSRGGTAAENIRCARPSGAR